MTDDLFASARTVADAVLYEGYVLYPYRASAAKNHVRWQFGVLAPRDWSEAGGCEAWWAQTECLIEAPLSRRLIGTTRFLRARQRRIDAIVTPADGDTAETTRSVAELEVDGRLLTSWQEGVERAVDFEVELGELLTREHTQPFACAASREVEDVRSASGELIARVVREEQAIEGAVRLSLTRSAGSSVLKLRLRVENLTPTGRSSADREQALPQFFVAVHTLLGLPGGGFLSLADPPAWAGEVAETCVNERGWPVLIGDADRSDVVLATPIILDDHPQIAPESAGDLCDATEIDEILTLRTMTLTDAEKREARATDARAAAIIDRVDSMSPGALERLHGTFRNLRQVPDPLASAELTPPWWDPIADGAVSPETDAIEIRGVSIAKGSRVRLCPGQRRADAQDMFLVDRLAVVEGVFVDVDDRHYLAVTLEDDPAAELHQWHGRYFYFAPDEVEPLESNT